MVYLKPTEPTEVLAAWNQVVGSALGSAIKLVELNGEMFNHMLRWQLYDWSTSLVSGAQCMHHTWEILLPHLSQPSDKRARVALLVTSKIGKVSTAICKRLVEEGHQVIATHLACEREIARKWQADHQAKGYKIFLIECDVTRFESCTRMSEQVQARFGAIDILVNCISLTRDKNTHKLEGDRWPSILDTHLDSLFNVIRNLIDGMIERRYGRIITIFLINGQKDQPGQIHCAAAKAGLVGFTRSLARELVDQGVTVNMVSPGQEATSMVMAAPEEIRQRISRKIPVGRFSEPEEIAHTVAFLASEESSYITGTDIVLSGGLSPPSRSPPSLRRGGGMKKNTPGPAL